MFRVKIETNNHAFYADDDHPEFNRETRNGEVARILRELADRLADQYGNGRSAADLHILQDSNGNTVGKAGFGR